MFFANANEDIAEESGETVAEESANAEDGVEGEEPEWDENNSSAGTPATPGETVWLPGAVKEELVLKAENGTGQHSNVVLRTGDGVGRGKGKKKKVTGRISIMWARQPTQFKFFPCRVCESMFNFIFITG